MNYLAHAWLARHSDDAILGAILGDFVHGQSTLQAWPPTVRAEIVRHRHIDTYTDDHPDVVAARALFDDGLRRFSGIVLDVYFDHRLARDWHDWNDTPLREFTARVYRVLGAHRDVLPARLKRIAPLMAADDWLGSYVHRRSLDGVVYGISRRLSRDRDKLLACLPVLRAHEAQVDAAFDRFFPQLVAAAEAMHGDIDA